MRLLIRKAVILGPPPTRNRAKFPFVGRVEFQGIPIRIETAKGQTRSGVDADGKPWSILFRAHYGEVAGTMGLDKDPVDVYIGPDETATTAYVVHQKAPGTQAIDEDKVLLGCQTAEEAEHLYREHYDHPGFFDGITSWPVAELREYLADPANRGKRLDRPAWVREKIGRREGLRAVLRKGIGGQVMVRAHERHGPHGEVEQVRQHQRVVRVGDVHPGASFPIDHHYERIHIRKVKDGQAEIAYHSPDGPRQQIPIEQVSHLVHDLNGTLAHHAPTSGHKDVDAVIRGEGRFLGKGNDGLVWATPGGKHVVKASTTVPYQPMNGYRTPAQAAAHLQNEADAHEAHHEDPMVPRINAVAHEGRTFLVKPFLQSPGELSKVELDQVRDSVQRMHARGWTLNDQIQVGRDAEGHLKHMDLGSSTRGASEWDRKGDIAHLERLYREHGQDYTPGGEELQRQDDKEHDKLMTALAKAKERGRGKDHPLIRLQRDHWKRLHSARSLELLTSAEKHMDTGGRENEAMRAWHEHQDRGDKIEAGWKALPEQGMKKAVVVRMHHGGASTPRQKAAVPLMRKGRPVEPDEDARGDALLDEVERRLHAGLDEGPAIKAWRDHQRRAAHAPSRPR